MTSTATDTRAAPRPVLDGAARSKADREAGSRSRWRRPTIEWAVLNEADPDRVCRVLRRPGDPGGRPGCAVGLGVRVDGVRRRPRDVRPMPGSPRSARVLELRYRLPRLWARVMAGRLPVWRAGRIADHTTSLPAAGAAHVDRHLAPVAHSCSWAQLDRTVEEAMVRFDPEAAEAKRREAAESRHVDVLLDQVSFDGTVRIDAEVDLADALDLEDALRAGREAAGRPRVAPSPSTYAAPSPWVTSPAASSPSGSKHRRPGRSVDSIVAPLRGRPDRHRDVGRCGNTRSPISVEQIREWCGNRDTSDRETGGRPGRPHPRRGLRSPRPAQRPERPGRRPLRVPVLHQTRAIVRHRPRRSPTPTAGPTCSDNTAPLCRRHHRAKTHSAWDYSVLDRGTYLWTTPNGLQLIRDHHGTPCEP